jgi:predicted negative regulator of RcsB-dependent stress response
VTRRWAFVTCRFVTGFDGFQTGCYDGQRIDLEGENSLARLTRHELKQDQFLTTLEEFENFAKQQYKGILGLVVGVILVAGSVFGFRFWSERQESESNALLGTALKTFHASVGSASVDLFGGQTQANQAFPTAHDKYKKALEQFDNVVGRFPRQKAAAIARYHAGLCQAELGDQAAAIKTLQEASRASDQSIGSLAKLALAGELVRTGKLDAALKLYRELQDHPTSTVPKATAMLALADAYRQSQPAQARQIYQQMEKEFSSNTYLAATVKQQMESLPK